MFVHLIVLLVQVVTQGDGVVEPLLELAIVVHLFSFLDWNPRDRVADTNRRQIGVHLLQHVDSHLGIRLVGRRAALGLRV